MNKTFTESVRLNSGFKKLAVQWLIEHSTAHQHLWWLDSFVLRNRQLLKPAKRYTKPVGSITNSIYLQETGDPARSDKPVWPTLL